MDDLQPFATRRTEVDTPATPEVREPGRYQPELTPLDNGRGSQVDATRLSGRAHRLGREPNGQGLQHCPETRGPARAGLRSRPSSTSSPPPDLVTDPPQSLGRITLGWCVCVRLTYSSAEGAVGRQIAGAYFCVRLKHRQDHVDHGRNRIVRLRRRGRQSLESIFVCA
jgi:hypothetical protein